MRSNSYTVFFTAAITVVLGLLLSIAATSLKKKQLLNIELDIKKNILIALNIQPKGEEFTPDEIEKEYEKTVVPIVVDSTGAVIENISSNSIENTNDQFPVFMQMMGDKI